MPFEILQFIPPPTLRLEVGVFLFDYDKTVMPEKEYHIRYIDKKTDVVFDTWQIAMCKEEAIAPIKNKIYKIIFIEVRDL